VLADTVSRKWCLVLAHVVMGSGMAFTGLVTAFPALIATQALWGLGWALSSGADVAWVTDELERPDLIDGVLALRARRELVGAAAGLVGVGALAWSADLATAVVAAGIAMVVLGLVDVARFPERRFRPTRHRRWAEATLIFREGIVLARRDRQILVVLIATLLVNGGGEAEGRLLQKRLLDLGFGPTADPILWFTALGLVTLMFGAVALRVMEARIAGTGVARRMYATVCVVGAVGVFLLAHAPDSRTAVAGVLMVEGIGFPVARAVSVIWINRRTTDRVRATVHSFLSQAENLGEILFGITLGLVAQSGGISAALTAAAALLGCAAVLVVVATRDRAPPRLVDL
jgi:predicted MFS family arabinose efflux permease